MADHIFGGVKVEDPEYWGLAEIISDEMADIALQMKKRTPYTFKEMCKLCKIEKNQEEAFQKILDEMSYIGLLEYDYGYHYDHNGRTAPQSERRYILPMFVPGSAELFNMEELPDGSNPRVTNHPDVAAFFERMTYIPLAGITQMVPPGGGGIGMHVIPVEKAISMENEAIDIEKLSYWLDKYEGKIGVGRCSCRASRKAIGDGCADDDFGWCIGVGDFADYCRETGKGHDITKEEALAILKRAEDNGFVHQITNIDGENKIFGICNCNVEICKALRTSQLFNTPNMSRSAYVAHVEKDKCVACGRCVEYCPAGAVRLGQKLCKKDGSEIKYPKQELPDATKWGPEKYDFNYRDNNRINTHETGTAPCKSACPAHIAVQGYIKMASQGRYQDALALIKKQNPFPAVCGAICNRRCEDACTRGKVDEALSIADGLGYVEANPALDLDGIDAAHKICILAQNGYQKFVDFDQIQASGIRNVTKLDMDYAKKLGYRFKMIAQAKPVKDGLGIDVSATLVNLNELVANVMDSYNVVEIDNDYVNNIIYYGRGAGRYVTASAVVSDIMKTHQVERWSHDYEDCKHVYPISSSRYYVRASKPVDIPYETYYSEKDDHIYITEEIELADLKNKLNDENAVIFKVRG